MVTFQRVNRKGIATRSAIYAFIKGFTEKRGYPPSIREIARGIGVSSNNTVHNQLQTMKAMGMVQMEDNVARSVRVVEAHEQKE